jgi:hypothetical protein
MSAPLRLTIPLTAQQLALAIDALQGPEQVAFFTELAKRLSLYPSGTIAVQVGEAVNKVVQGSPAILDS